MTYGVDQCRRCGKPIKVTDGKAHAKANPKALAAAQKRSPWPEAKWRAEGLKAPPTAWEILHPNTGCCIDCSFILVRRKWQPLIRLILIIALIVFGVGFILFFTLLSPGA
jgi:hypothetical protein